MHGSGGSDWLLTTNWWTVYAGRIADASATKRHQHTTPHHATQATAAALDTACTVHKCHVEHEHDLSCSQHYLPTVNTDKRMVWLDCTAIYRVINCSRHEVTPITHFVLDKTTRTTENASDWSEHAILWQKVQKNEKGNPQSQRNLCYFLGI